jgi:hypothetical protein
MFGSPSVGEQGPSPPIYLENILSAALVVNLGESKNALVRAASIAA